MPKAIHFGAGNIGRGFIGPLLVDSGYHVTFADVNESLIDSLNAHDHYTVHILSQRSSTTEVTDFSGVVSTSPDLLDEFPTVDLITTSVGAQILPKIAPTIAKGLKRLYQERPDALVDIIACENGVGASEILRKEVGKHLKKDASPAEIEFFDKCVGFANCSVDRIVPPFDPTKAVNGNGEKRRKSKGHELDVGVEDFYEWVVDQDALKTDHNIHGMKLARDLLAYVERKLFTLNTAHATIAYLGWLKGYETVNEAIEDKQIYDIAKGAVAESGRALLKKHTIFSKDEHERYINTILDRRLKNPSVQDEIKRVCRAPKRKLGRNDRLVGPAMMDYEYGVGKPTNLAKSIAAAIWYSDKDDEDAVAIRDMVSEGGVEKVLREVSGLKKGTKKADQLVDHVVKAYGDLRSELDTSTKLNGHVNGYLN
ncbi:hypothetical protein TWF569_004592 [Orbilia oligospora]|uniref:Mannitol-1-phosphate 5-dehydrogenase n=1 Tax=Orbilia oligospora TaxID=2813651 RepID=A0A7C8J8A4_ORBOL|nr:hypothetical protein TWF706_001284 [Orbilia oligospora]KAF3092807.1 hypothetical protein TWF102_008305 [Orbilia oligospora]KAF3093682.1 hypothetical protein TWF103_010752 [Orbilia oligospora]KAF3144344.1 hypothetical protein TWF594_004867 [Orbilia oligospora]KAF3150724.1 hypothetical protein TWF569_004592 [Orbilia oligospora]